MPLPFRPLDRATAAILLISGSLLAQTQTTDSPANEASNGAATTKWFGTLDVKVARLRLMLDVSIENGKQTGVLTSLDQGNAEIPLDRFTLSDGKMEFAADRIKASFTGPLSDDGQQVVGKFTQMGVTHDLTLAQVEAVPEQHLKVAWAGDLEAGGQTLRLQFRELTTDDGQQIVLFDSLTQRAEGMTTEMKADGQKITFLVPAVRGKFAGTMSDDGNSIDGTWSQLGASYPLSLTKKETEEKAPERTRPQTPKPPFDYQSEDVSFENKQQGHQLAGTLTLPATDGPFPCIVLVTGSGPQDRDETIMGHKPFAVIADHLAKNGIATLRYDDRGTGKSKGEFLDATTADFATDAEAAIELVKHDDRIDPTRIGLVGHSEGGLICAMVGAQREDLAHVILLAGPGVPGDQIIIDQSAAMARAVGATESVIEDQQALLTELVAAAKSGVTQAQIKEILAKHPAATRLSDGEDDFGDASFLAMQLQQFGSPWFKYFLNYDPHDDLRNMNCPTLALIGEKDLQVTAELNLPELKSALRGDQHRVAELAGLNHLFQPCTTGAATEYDAIDVTMDDSLLQRITEWIHDH